MPIQTIIRAIEFKLYPNAEQASILSAWLRRCCWIFNRALEQRTKAYQRRGDSVTLYDQYALLTKWRGRIESLREVPAQFERDAIRRVDRGMKGFFDRCSAGEKPGFPRFRSHHRYNSLEQLEPAKYIRERAIFVPGIGQICARGQASTAGKQKGIRVIRRATGWYAQVITEQKETAIAVEPVNTCGIDLGLTSFATLDNGEKIKNPRVLQNAAKKIKRHQQKIARSKKSSNRRKKAVIRYGRLHEKVARRRNGFCHRLSRELVNRFDGIALENLNVQGLARSRLAKSILDASWSIFAKYIAYKAESAGKQCVFVNARGTSQECPQCGTIERKKLSERIHHCPACGLVIDRDEAAAMVVRKRGFSSARGDLLRPLATGAAGSMKRKVQIVTSLDTIYTANNP